MHPGVLLASLFPALYNSLQNLERLSRSLEFSLTTRGVSNFRPLRKKKFVTIPACSMCTWLMNESMT